MARYLGPDGFGLLSYSTAVFGILAPLAILGMPEILVREFSTREDWQAVLVSALVLQLPVAVLAAAGSAVVIFMTRGFSGEVLPIVLALLPLPLFALRFTARSYLEAKGQVRRIVRIGLIASGLASAIKVGAVLLGGPIWVFAVAASAEAGLVAVGLLGSIGRDKGRVGLRRYFRPQVARALLRESWPLALAMLATTVYMRVDVLMLGILTTDSVTGTYVAAAQLSEAWYFLPVAAMAAVRPQLARLFVRGQMDEYATITQRFMTVAFVVAFAAATMVFLFGNQLIGLVYGGAFETSALVLQIHVIAAPFVFLGIAAGQWFIDRGLTKAILVRSATGAIANIALNLVLIPTHGAVGAAIATLVSYSLSGVLVNALQSRTRPLFRLQMRAIMLRWR